MLHIIKNFMLFVEKKETIIEFSFKSCFFIDDMIVYVEKPNKHTHTHTPL